MPSSKLAQGTSVPTQSELIHRLADTTGATADQLFAAAFAVPRDPRSTAYKAGVLAALRFRIEGRRIPKLYDPASAEDDAYHAGTAEGHAVWRRAQQLCDEVRGTLAGMAAREVLQ